MKDVVSVIIPTLNGGDLLRDSLEMIFSQKVDFSIEVIVIDSGSVDNTVNLCADYPVKLIQIPGSSFSHSSTRNLAISQSKGDVCVLTVQDAVPVDNQWLATLVGPLRKTNKIAGVFGQQVSRSGASSLSKCCKVLWYQSWRTDWQKAYEQLPVKREEWQKLSSEQKRARARFDNVNSCFRRSVWEKIPFPDVSYAEDIAWAMKVLVSGFSIYWQPGAQVFHSHDRSLAYEFKRSYVDAKTLTNIFKDCKVTITYQMARSVVYWLADEACRFILDSDSEHPAKKRKAIELISKADQLWQQSNMKENMLKKGCDDLAQAHLRVHKLKNTYLNGLSRGILESALLRRIGKKIISVINKREKRQFNDDHVRTSFLLELQGRHRFFFNQLLQIAHFDNHHSRKKDDGCLRLGVAAMVAGSLLGQYLNAIEGSTISDARNDVGLNVEPNGDDDFWYLLEEWCQNDSVQTDLRLVQLNQLLTGGV